MDQRYGQRREALPPVERAGGLVSGVEFDPFGDSQVDRHQHQAGPVRGRETAKNKGQLSQAVRRPGSADAAGFTNR